MSPKRTIALLAAALALTTVAGACSSSDDDPAPTTSGVVLTMATTPPEATRLGVCTSFTTEQVQELLEAKKLGPSMPEKIDEEGGAVTGESCTWLRTDKGGSTRSVRIEARDYGADRAALGTRFDELRANTAGATDLEGVDDAAFSASTDETSVVQVKRGQYLLTATSRGTGKLDPLTPAQLGILLGTTFDKLP